MIPTLLLSPAQSRDRAGMVAPLIASTVTVVPGQYAPAWKSNSTTVAVHVQALPYLNPARNTIFVKWKRANNPTSYIFAAGTYNRDFLAMLNYQGSLGGDVLFNSSANAGGVHNPAPRWLEKDIPEKNGEWMVGVIRCRGNRRDAWLGRGLTSLDMAYTPPVWTADHRLGFGVAANNVGWEVEAILIYSTDLTDAEVNRIRTMDRAWTWASVVDRVPVILRTTPDEPYVIARTNPPEPYVVARTVPPEPYVISRTVPPEPYVISRTPGES